ncbi:MAG: VWA domain-containing protein, partial [Muribaculaceae bacterium]|nr:VWA domain-containing protein [Muribaculaceae bacterium]
MTQNIRQRNIVYVVDCTGSMNGHNGAPDIWVPTKNFLKSELKKEIRENPGAKITVLPFQDRVLTPIRINPSDLNWPEHEKTLDSYISNLTATNICDAWLESERYIDEACENYIVLMTDGHDNIGGSANEKNRITYLSEILKAFCGKYANTKGFYVELTQNATLPGQISNILDICEDLYRIDATEGIPSFGCVSTDIVEINTRDLPVDIDFGFSNSGDFSSSVDVEENEIVDISIKDNKISRGRFVIHIESKFGDNLEKLNNLIDNEVEEVDVKVVADEIMITNPDLTFAFVASPIRSLDLGGADDASFFAEVKRIKPFLRAKGIGIDTLQWNLAPRFSQEAVNDRSFARLKLSVKGLPDVCDIRFDGKKLNDSVFVLDPNDSGLLEVLIPRDIPDDKVEITLVLVGAKNLDRINNSRPTPPETLLTLVGEWKTEMSIAEIIFWSLLGLVLLSIIIWFVALRDM